MAWPCWIATTLRVEKLPAVADAVDLIDDRNGRIASAQKIGMQRMRRPVFHGAAGGDQGLADHLAAEDALPADLWAQAAKEISLQRFEIEDGEQFVESAAHGDPVARLRLPPFTSFKLMTERGKRRRPMASPDPRRLL